MRRILCHDEVTCERALAIADNSITLNVNGAFRSMCIFCVIFKEAMGRNESSVKFVLVAHNICAHNVNLNGLFNKQSRTHVLSRTLPQRISNEIAKFEQKRHVTLRIANRSDANASNNCATRRLSMKTSDRWLKFVVADTRLLWVFGRRCGQPIVVILRCASYVECHVSFLYMLGLRCKYELECEGAP